MGWDDTKTTADDPDKPDADERLTAEEWNTHVDEGHWSGDELQFQIDSGDPVLVDPQNSDEIVARYDRGPGKWMIDALQTDNATVTNKTDTRRIDFDIAIDTLYTATIDTTTEIDLSKGAVWDVDVTQNTTIDLLGVSSDGVYSVTLFIEDNGNTVDFANTIEWAQGEPPGFSNELTIVSLTTRDAGTTYQGVFEAGFA